MDVSQSSYIAVFLIIGFFVYITIKGELVQYKTAIIGGQPTQPTGAA